jgi:hypothetical protein
MQKSLTGPQSPQALLKWSRVKVFGAAAIKQTNRNEVKLGLKIC